MWILFPGVSHQLAAGMSEKGIFPYEYAVSYKFLKIRSLVIEKYESADVQEEESSTMGDALKTGEEAAVARALKILMDRKELSVPELSDRTKIPKTTLYSMLKKQTNQADLDILKKLSDFFGEDVSIFCGIENYKPPLKLTKDESVLLAGFRGLNQNGQESLMSYLTVLAGNPSMKK